MVYTGNNEYKTKFYKNSRTGKSPVLEYIGKLRPNEKSKILKYIEFLRQNKGFLHEPYCKHIRGKIWELRVDFGHKRHRIFYFTFIKRAIILLHVFLKKMPKTPLSEIKRAEECYGDVLSNKNLYE